MCVYIRTHIHTHTHTHTHMYIHAHIQRHKHQHLRPLTIISGLSSRHNSPTSTMSDHVAGEQPSRHPRPAETLCNRHLCRMSTIDAPIRVELVVAWLQTRSPPWSLVGAARPALRRPTKADADAAADARRTEWSSLSGHRRRGKFSMLSDTGLTARKIEKTTLTPSSPNLPSMSRPDRAGRYVDVLAVDVNVDGDYHICCICYTRTRRSIDVIATYL